ISVGQMHFQRGAVARAIESFREGLAVADEVGDRYQQIRALNYLGLAELARGGSPEEALARARTAAELAHETLVGVGEIYGLATQGLALARMGRTEDAVALTARAVPLPDQTQQPERADQL